MSIVGLQGVSSLGSTSSTLGPKVQETPKQSFLNTLIKGLQGTSTSSTSGTSGAGGNPNVEQLRQQTTQSKQQFQQKLIQALLQQGVDISQPITLQGDGFGGVKVVGSHSDKQLIEAMFEDNPDLRQEFQQLASQAEQLYQQDSSAIPTTDGPKLTTDGIPMQTQPQFSLILHGAARQMAFLRAAS
ncbi:MAG: hypothetical protein U0903_07820 [Planctomycetales bacterium]